MYKYVKFSSLTTYPINPNDYTQGGSLGTKAILGLFGPLFWLREALLTNLYRAFLKNARILLYHKKKFNL